MSSCARLKGGEQGLLPIANECVVTRGEPIFHGLVELTAHIMQCGQIGSLLVD